MTKDVIIRKKQGRWQGTDEFLTQRVNRRDFG